MKINDKISVDTGTLTVRKISKDGKINIVTCWFSSVVGKEYCCEVQMSEEYYNKLKFKEKDK